MPNGLSPDPRGLRITVSGSPRHEESWRTEPLPKTHTRGEGYRITKADADRILDCVKQQLDPITAGVIPEPGAGAQLGDPGDETGPTVTHEDSGVKIGQPGEESFGHSGFPVGGDPIPQAQMQRGGPVTQPSPGV